MHRPREVTRHPHRWSSAGSMAHGVAARRGAVRRYAQQTRRATRTQPPKPARCGCPLTASWPHAHSVLLAQHLVSPLETGVLILSQDDDESYVWALLEKGVEGYGYLHKVRVGDVDQLVRAIREVAAGGSVLDPRILHDILAHRAGKRGSPLAELTPGERDVLRLMAEDRRNSAIADRISVSLGTVEKRIAGVFSKLDLPDEADVNRRVAAVLVYLRETMPGR